MDAIAPFTFSAHGAENCRVQARELPLRGLFAAALSWNGMSGRQTEDKTGKQNEIGNKEGTQVTSCRPRRIPEQLSRTSNDAKSFQWLRSTICCGQRREGPVLRNCLACAARRATNSSRAVPKKHDNAASSWIVKQGFMLLSLLSILKLTERTDHHVRCGRHRPLKWKRCSCSLDRSEANK